MTSAQAAKELKKLSEQHEALLAQENKASTFVAAIQEDIESNSSWRWMMTCW